MRGEAGDGQILGIGVVSPEALEAVAGDDGKPYIRIQPATPTSDVRFVNILFPADQTTWSSRPDIILEEDTGDAVLVRVEMDDGTGRVDDILVTYGQPTSAVTIGAYQYDGRVAIISRNAGGDIERLFLGGGTFLTDQTDGRELVVTNEETAAIEANYSDHTVSVYGSIYTNVRLYAPTAEQLKLNGVFWSFARSGDAIVFAPIPTYIPLLVKTMKSSINWRR
jgi:hypothetical protein